MKTPAWLSRTAAALAVSAALLSPSVSQAVNLGVEGQIYEILEEDFRLILMKLVARHDWTVDQEELKASARDYTKNLPSYMLPRADKTLTRWKDVGIVVSEDIYIPWVDWETGSVFAPTKALLAEAGTYLNPIAKMPSGSIERLFVFDGTDPDQLSMARALMAKNIPQLSFMMIAGDIGELSEQMQRPVYHPPPSMLEKFHIRAVPTLVGFGRGTHQGHMALTEIKLPSPLTVVTDAWFGLGDRGESETPLEASPLQETTEPTPAADGAAQ